MEIKHRFTSPKSKLTGHLFLGDHGDDRVDGLDAYESTLNKYAKRRTKRKILVVKEDVYRPLASAELIDHEVRQGNSPTIAFTKAVFLDQQGYVPNILELTNFIPGLWSTLGRFSQQELAILDEINRNHPGKIRLLWEGTPTQSLLKRLRRLEYGELQKRAQSLTREGQFASALIPFKKSSKVMAQDAKEREDLLHQRTMTELESEPYQAIIGHLGLGHTGFGHRLQNDNIPVEMHFTDKVSGSILFDPASQAVRHLLFKPQQDINQLQWHQYLVGDVLYHTLVATGMTQGRGEMDQEAIKIAIQAAASFRNMSDIRALERAIRSNGFLETIQNLSS